MPPPTPPGPTQHSPAQRRRYKSLALAKSSNVPLLGRTSLVASLQSAAATAPPPPPGQPLSSHPLLDLFTSGKIWPWISHYLATSFSPKYKPYPTCTAPNSGVYTLHAQNGGNLIKLSIVGDWGTGTDEAVQVAAGVTAFAPDYTIHLGDVYYVGDQPEVDENFLGVDNPKSPYSPVTFPTGSVGTFALIGNHEMYGGGKPFFKTILPYCKTAGAPQQAPFFCLETPHWRILGIDTGYNSVGTFILGSIPGINKIPIFGANCRLQDGLLTWLRSNVDPRQNKKPTLLLSHHQYFSAYSDEAFPKPAQQLKDFFAGQEVVWLWGHEHRLSIYDKFSPDGNITCYARCIGHGGMPVEDGTGYNLKKAPLAYYDPRDNYPVGDGSTAGYNGFVNLTMEGPKLTLDYLDLNRQPVFSEIFVATPGGIMQTMLSPGLLKSTKD